MDQLAATVERADRQFAETLSQYEAAQLVTEQTRADVDQRIRVVDPPERPLFAQPQRRRDGAEVGAVHRPRRARLDRLVAVVTALDHTVRREADIEAQAGLAVVATVPNAR